MKKIHFISVLGLGLLLTGAMYLSSCKSSSGEVDPAGPQGATTKIVIVPANDLRNGRKAAVDYTNYNEVKAYYNLPD